MHKFVVFGAAAAALVFIWLMGADLPELVAAHFSFSGKADGTMQRGYFLALMTVLATVAPVLVWWLQISQIAYGHVKIPHRAHWFTGEHKERTVRWLTTHAVVFPVATSVFMCFTFWLAALANSTSPATLPPGPFLMGLGVYLLVVVGWGVAPHVRFKRPGA